LPDGVSFVNKTTAKVTVEIKALQTKTFTVSAADINWAGKSAQFDYLLSPESLSVTVKGKEEHISKLTLASMAPTLDLQDKNAVGTYNVVLRFPGLDENCTLDGEYIFTVTITDAKTETESPAPLPANAA
jgi:hypothetical protein